MGKCSLSFITRSVSVWLIRYHSKIPTGIITQYCRVIFLPSQRERVQWETSCNCLSILGFYVQGQQLLIPHLCMYMYSAYMYTRTRIYTYKPKSSQKFLCSGLTYLFFFPTPYTWIILFHVAINRSRNLKGCLRICIFPIVLPSGNRFAPTD